MSLPPLQRLITNETSFAENLAVGTVVASVNATDPEGSAVLIHFQVRAVITLKSMKTATLLCSSFRL